MSVAYGLHCGLVDVGVAEGLLGVFPVSGGEGVLLGVEDGHLAVQLCLQLIFKTSAQFGLLLVEVKTLLLENLCLALLHEVDAALPTLIFVVLLDAQTLLPLLAEDVGKFPGGVLLLGGYLPGCHAGGFLLLHALFQGH